jgi:hypothetical protein
MISRRHFWKFYEFLWFSLQIGRISGYFQYPVSGRISGKSNPVSCRIPDIKKKFGLSGRISGASLLGIIYNSTEAAALKKSC